MCTFAIYIFKRSFKKYHLNILLTRTTAAQNVVALSYHIVRGLHFLAVVIAITIVSSCFFDILPLTKLCKVGAQNTSKRLNEFLHFFISTILLHSSSSVLLELSEGSHEFWVTHSTGKLLIFLDLRKKFRCHPFICNMIVS